MAPVDDLEAGAPAAGILLPVENEAPAGERSTLLAAAESANASPPAWHRRVHLGLAVLILVATAAAVVALGTAGWVPPRLSVLRPEAVQGKQIVATGDAAPAAGSSGDAGARSLVSSKQWGDRGSDHDDAFSAVLGVISDRAAEREEDRAAEREGEEMPAPSGSLPAERSVARKQAEVVPTVVSYSGFGGFPR